MNTIATDIITKACSKKGPFVVGICGGSASGKSTISESIKNNLVNKGAEVIVINQDDFSIGKDFEDKDISPYKWDDPKNYRIDECISIINNIINNKQSNFLAYTLEAHKPTIQKTIQPFTDSDLPKIIIIEGIFAWYAKLYKMVDFKIYLELNFYDRFILRLNRNVFENKVTDIDTVINQYFTHVAKAQKDFLEPMRLQADFVINRKIILPNPILVNDTQVLIKNLKFLCSDDRLSIGITEDIKPIMAIKINGRELLMPISVNNSKLLNNWVNQQ